MPTPTDAPPLIHARGLTKRFGEFTAVDAIDFDVAPGESFGFLGPNGAGKTSTMRMVACVSPVTEGTLRILDLDPNADGPRIRGRLGVVPQQDTLDTELSVKDNLVIYGRYFGLSRAEAARRGDELLDFAQLTERANDKVEPLSGGMKRRLTIARALINEPSILLLDEPTTGLDPQARHLLWERLYRLKQRGVTLVLTTHYMDEAEQLCDRLVVMDKAKIVAEGSPRQLIDEYSSREVTELRFPVGVQETLDGQLDGLGERIEHLPDRVLVYSGRRRGASRPRPTSAGWSRRRCSSGGRRWRTCSCASPGGASSTDGGRGDVVRVGIARAGDGRRRPAPERRARRARGVRAHVAALPADVARLDLRLVRPAGAVPRRDGDRPRRLRGRVEQRGDGRRAVHRVPRARRCSCRPSCRAPRSRARSRSSAASTGTAATTRCSRPR